MKLYRDHPITPEGIDQFRSIVNRPYHAFASRLGTLVSDCRAVAHGGYCTEDEAAAILHCLTILEAASNSLGGVFSMIAPGVTGPLEAGIELPSAPGGQVIGWDKVKKEYGWVMLPCLRRVDTEIGGGEGEGEVSNE